MDNLQFYFDGSTGLFRYADEGEDDSGVEDLPFSFYSPERFGSPDTLTQLSQTSACNDADDEDLTYIDDVRDGDYRPHKSAYVSKKGKRPYRRRQYNGDTCLSQLMSPEKLQHRIYAVSNVQEETPIRHYARKDRTPNTILKMMERHRESERVRHHTLNESMKDVCLRVPGYDPDVKETKVIQMQRIIAYECFLENTLTNICEKIGMSPKSLKISTHFITDAMKNTPIEDFYQPSNYKTSDIEDECAVHTVKIEPHDTLSSSPSYRIPGHTLNEENFQKYRQEKISSPTIDSTTDDFVKVLPLSPVPQMPGYQFFNSYPTQCFIPIDSSSQNIPSSQESGIKTEEGTQSTIYDEDNHFNEDIGSFMDQSICVEPDQFKTVTPSFMKEEINTSFTSFNESDQYHAFDLSSPIRHHGKVFLQSPKTKGVWSRHDRHCFLGKADTPMGKEMQSVSPENVLETKPKVNQEVEQSNYDTSQLFMPAVCPVTNMHQTMSTNQIIQNAQNSNEMQYVYDQQGRQFSTYKVFSGMTRENGCIKVQHIYIPKFENGILKLDGAGSAGKNKRKRYTPLRAAEGTKHVYVESDEDDTDRLSDVCGETTDTDIEDHDLDMEQQQQQSQPIPQLPLGNYPYGFPQNWGYPAPAPCRGQGKKVKYAKPLVDHRKSTWMNGFMMFSKINRPKFTGANPGVHTSQIQKLMGEAWRKLSAEEKEPYKDQAKEWCERMKTAGDNANKDKANGNVKQIDTDQTKSNSAIKLTDPKVNESETFKAVDKEGQSTSESTLNKSQTLNGTQSSNIVSQE